MKSRSSFTSRRLDRGSALITVLLFSFLLITLAASVMNWALTERRLNSRSAYWLEARNAAEAVAEYGCYQVAQAFNTQMNPTLNSGSTQVTFPSTVANSFFANSRVSLSSIELRAGTVTKVPATNLYYIDPADPSNAQDPLVGRYVNRRDVTVLSKVTVNPPAGGAPVTAYIQEKVSVRGAPLLAYAIFYSGTSDLEVNPLPQMDIYGPVHVNGHMFVGSVSNGVTLNFHGPVTVAGHIFHSWRGTTSTAQQGSSMSSTSAVQFATDTTGNNLASMRTGASVWNDSTMGASAGVTGVNNLVPLVTAARITAFAQHSAQTWKGNLQTSAMGIQAYNPMGFNEVVGNNGSDIVATSDAADYNANVGTSGTYSQTFGHGYGPHSLIEPPMTVPTSDTYATAKQAIEEQKFSRKAGLYLKVKLGSTGMPDSNGGYMKLYADPNSGASPPPGTPVGTEVRSEDGRVLLGDVPTAVFSYVKYTTGTSGGNTVVQKGMYDQRQDKGINLVRVDLGALRTAMTDMIGTGTTAGTDIITRNPTTTKWTVDSTYDKGYDPYNPGSKGWNGGLYIEVDTSGYTAANEQTAVILANGYVASGSMLPTVNSTNGLTVATNAPVYILGNLNSNGVVGSSGTSNSALYPDDTASGTAITLSVESPVAVAGDTVTILSPDYFGTESSSRIPPDTTNASTTNAYKSYYTNSPTATVSAVGTHTEIAAALISGTTTTSPTSSGTQQYSGGVHNMPRFLENWSNKTVAIRGSLVSMYSARVATGAWSSSYYSPPTRQWGFDQLFANGKFPPIIPQVLSYRRIDFTYLPNAAAYTAAVNAL